MKNEFDEYFLYKSVFKLLHSKQKLLSKNEPVKSKKIMKLDVQIKLCLDALQTGDQTEVEELKKHSSGCLIA